MRFFLPSREMSARPEDGFVVDAGAVEVDLDSVAGFDGEVVIGAKVGIGALYFANPLPVHDVDEGAGFGVEAAVCFDLFWVESEREGVAFRVLESEEGDLGEELHHSGAMRR